MIDRAAILQSLLSSEKPKIIGGVYHDYDMGVISPESIMHLRTADYLWQREPSDYDDSGKDLYLGILLDDSLAYVFLVFATQKFLQFLYDL